MIDWPALTNNLRRRYGTLTRAARAIDVCPELLRRLNRGETEQPKFEIGVRLIDAHFDACPEHHHELRLE